MRIKIYNSDMMDLYSTWVSFRAREKVEEYAKKYLRENGHPYGDYNVTIGSAKPFTIKYRPTIKDICIRSNLHIMKTDYAEIVPGARVRIVADHCGHDREIGSIWTVEGVTNNGRTIWLTEGGTYVTPKDIKLLGEYIDESMLGEEDDE